MIRVQVLQIGMLVIGLPVVVVVVEMLLLIGLVAVVNLGLDHLQVVDGLVLEMEEEILIIKIIWMMDYRILAAAVEALVVKVIPMVEVVEVDS